jgi:hypothetical protein
MKPVNWSVVIVSVILSLVITILARWIGVM